MSESQEQRSSSSDSDNFEKIDSDEARQEDSPHNPHFVVGDDADPDPAADYDGPAHEGRDSFPNAPPPNIRRALTQAQQLALAEKRSKLRDICTMLKRRTSKRFVLGDNPEPQSFDDEEPTEVLPNLAHKFQMTLQSDPEVQETKEEKQTIQPDRKLLKPPSGTLQSDHSDDGSR